MGWCWWWCFFVRVFVCFFKIFCRCWCFLKYVFEIACHPPHFNDFFFFFNISISMFNILWLSAYQLCIYICLLLWVYQILCKIRGEDGFPFVGDFPDIIFIFWKWVDVNVDVFCCSSFFVSSFFLYFADVVLWNVLTCCKKWMTIILYKISTHYTKKHVIGQ